MTTDMVRFAPHHVTPELTAVAIQYVHQYQGDFSYLVDVKNRIAAMGEKSLTRYMIKGVLNCMLHDPNVVNLPRPETIVFDVVEEVHVSRRTRRVRRMRFDLRESAATDWDMESELEADREEEAGAANIEKPQLNPYRRLELKSRWKFDYGISDHTKACRVHIVDPSSSAVRWYPGGADPRDDVTDWTNPYVELRLKWLCKTAWSMGRSPRYELMDYEAAWKLVATHTHWEWCATCQRIEEKQRVLSNRKSW
jgi:hypothetical protein